MKLNYRLIVFVALIVAVAGACSKKYKQPDTVEPNVVNPFGGPPGSLTPGSQLNKLFKDLRSVPERQCVTAGVLQTISFSKGTVLTFYPHSFKYKNGSLVTSGEVCLEVIEMYNPGSMIANRATTMSDEGLLQSGGQVYIKATKNGEEVFANVYGIGFKQPMASTQTMNLYYGNTDNRDSVTKWTSPNAQLPGTTANGTTDDSAATYYFFDSCTNFNWVNCDRIPYMPGDLRTPLYIHVSDTSFNKTNMDVYVILPTFNIVAWADITRSNSPQTYQVAPEGDTPHQVPVGTDAIIVLISKKNGTYYYYQQAVLVTDGMTVYPTLEARSEEYILERLSEI